MLLIMAKPQKTLDAFFKRKDSSESPTSLTPCQINVEHSTLAQEQRPPKSPRIESRKDDNLNSLQRDPGLRQQIWNYLVNERDEIRRAYIKAGPYHVVLSKYPASGPEDHPRRFQSSCLIKMFKATCEVLQSIVKRGSNYSQPALQQKSQDILNAMHHLSTTRALVQKLREDGWDSFLETTKSFCEKYEIDVSDMSGLYIMGRGRSCHQKDQITIEHHYQIDLSTATIDSQLQELNSRFSEKTMEFITLSSALDPKDGFK
ncbi:uncharacterized protein LOC127901453 isoform X6 [Citrus sinensis]|uniref:uncharacterized protein LOC127901453 isoform X6 n=1 Tax=Citrus sinensis TaxID=2711 RepID=UPI0022794E3E|nr:uncharacterized protein LOC127901453 isoform X6 [Citrus sinensis]